jgi:hypothetical protein
MSSLDRQLLTGRRDRRPRDQDGVADGDAPGLTDGAEDAAAAFAGAEGAGDALGVELAEAGDEAAACPTGTAATAPAACRGNCSG